MSSSKSSQARSFLIAARNAPDPAIKDVLLDKAIELLSKTERERGPERVSGLQQAAE